MQRAAREKQFLMKVSLNRFNESKAMKSTRSIPYLFSAALLCSGPPQCIVQAPTGLSIQTYPNLTITASVGTVYTVQHTTNLARQNSKIISPSLSLSFPQMRIAR